jgi:hypothetical protein
LNLNIPDFSYEDEFVRIVLDDPDLIQSYQNISRVFDEISWMNEFRSAGPWISKKEVNDASTEYNYKVAVMEISTETEKKEMSEKNIGTKSPKMEDQMVDAVCEPEGLRLDNLKFGIIDGSGRRINIVVRNE